MVSEAPSMIYAKYFIYPRGIQVLTSVRQESGCFGFPRGEREGESVPLRRRKRKISGEEVGARPYDGNGWNRGTGVTHGLLVATSGYVSVGVVGWVGCVFFYFVIYLTCFPGRG